MRAERMVAGTAFLFFIAFASCRNDAPEKRKQAPPAAVSDVDKMDDRMPDLVRLEGAMAMTGEYKGKGVTIRLEKIKVAAYDNEADWAAWDASVSIPRDSGRYFTVKDNTIFLQLENKRRKAFASRGTEGDDDFVSYRYMSRVSGMKYFLFSAKLQQGGRATFLVDQRDGDVTSVLEHPSLSPNGEWMLATVPGNERDGNGAVQLLRMSGDSPETVFAMSCKGWSPAEVKWVNETTLVLKQERKGKEPVFARMSIR